MSNKQFNKLEIQFQEECKVINLRYEYDGYIGNEQWAIISELTEKEILEKYRSIVSDYIPFIVLTPAFGEVRDEYRRNENIQLLSIIKHTANIQSITIIITVWYITTSEISAIIMTEIIPLLFSLILPAASEQI